MRLDKYLKVSRIIKRRTVAKDASSSERILVNNKIAKPSTDIKVGDIITINYYKKDGTGFKYPCWETMEVKVKSITPSVKKDEALEMYEIINIIESKGEDYGN